MAEFEALHSYRRPMWQMGPLPDNLTDKERIVSVLYCVSPEGISGPAVQNLCLVHHWIQRRQNIGHTASAQLIFAAWMIAYLVQFSISAHLGKSTHLLYTSSR